MTGIIFFIIRILLIASLYAFLVWAIYTLWKDLQNQNSNDNISNFPPIHIIPVQHSYTEKHQLTKPQIILGRDPLCDVVIPMESISARHCHIYYNNNNWWLEDMESTNGTYINDNNVKEEVALKDNDIIQLGTISFLIKIPD